MHREVLWEETVPFCGKPVDECRSAPAFRPERAVVSVFPPPVVSPGVVPGRRGALSVRNSAFRRRYV